MQGPRLQQVCACCCNHPKGAFSKQRAHSANYYVVYPGNTPENHPPTEVCMINSKQHGVQCFVCDEGGQARYTQHIAFNGPCELNQVLGGKGGGLAGIQEPREEHSINQEHAV